MAIIEEANRTTTSKSASKSPTNIDSLRYIRHTIREEFDVWKRRTTFHGVPIIFRTTNLSLQLFWLALLLLSFGLCCYMLNRSLVDFFSYKIDTVIRTNPVRKLRFPIISVCNYDYFVTKNSEEYLKNYFVDNFNETVENYAQILNLFSDFDNFTAEMYWIYSDAYMLAMRNLTLFKTFGLSVNQFFHK